MNTEKVIQNYLDSSKELHFVESLTAQDMIGISEETWLSLFK